MASTQKYPENMRICLIDGYWWVPLLFHFLSTPHDFHIFGWTTKLMTSRIPRGSWFHEEKVEARWHLHAFVVWFKRWRLWFDLTCFCYLLFGFIWLEYSWVDSICLFLSCVWVMHSVSGMHLHAGIRWMITHTQEIIKSRYYVPRLWLPKYCNIW